jgi:hypothetical protein
MGTRVLHLPEHVLAALDQTTDQADDLEMEELVRAAVWAFDQQPADAQSWILLDCWDFGGLTRQTSPSPEPRGGRIGELVRTLVAKVRASFRP